MKGPDAVSVTVTDTVTDMHTDSCTWLNQDENANSDEEEEIHDVNSPVDVGHELLKPKDILSRKEDIPDSVLWHSVLSALEECADFNQLVQLSSELKQVLPKMKPRKEAVFSPECDVIDQVAQKEIPLDGPVHLKAIRTTGDGNCLTRSLSKVQYNTENLHVEM